LRQLAVLADTDNPFVKQEVNHLREAGAGFGVEIATFEMRRGEDIDPAFQVLKSRAQALYVPATSVALVNRIRINTLALAAHVPTMFGVREYVEAGGLMSYGPNWPQMWGRAADIVDKILRGAKPADLPVEQPTKFDFAINLTTAKALGLTVPDKLLAFADEVIE
jgi:putative ABC transport system substrate-binding protein